MKKIINSRVYNTATAEHLATSQNGHFNLYLKRNGELFIVEREEDVHSNVEDFKEEIINMCLDLYSLVKFAKAYWGCNWKSMNSFSTMEELRFHSFMVDRYNQWTMR